MKLQEWLEKNNISIKDFTEKTGFTRMSVYLWRVGKVIPCKIFQDLIHKETNGQVTFSDWEKK